MGSLIFRDGELHVFISKWLVRPGAFFAPVAVQQLRLWVSSRPRFCGYEHSDWFEVPDEIINRLQVIGTGNVPGSVNRSWPGAQG